MKKIILSLFFIFLLSAPVCADEATYNILNQQYESFGADNLKHSLDENALSNINEITEDFDFDKIAKDLMNGKPDISQQRIYKKVIGFFTSQFVKTLRLSLEIIILSILFGFVTNLQSSFATEGVGTVAFFVCYLMLSGICSVSFHEIVSIGSNTITSVMLFVQSAIPVLMGIMTATGSFATAGAFPPIIMFVLQAMSWLMKEFLVPALYFIMTLTIINNLSEKPQVGNLIELIKKIVKWSLGILVTVFVGVITVQGFATTAMDGIVGKTAKYSVGNLIPVIGGMLADSIDTVITCVGVIKNSVGLIGIIVISIICITPIIKIMVVLVIYRITAAVIEPISDERFVSAVSSISDCISMVLVMVISVCVMFIFALGVIIISGV